MRRFQATLPLMAFIVLCLAISVHSQQPRSSEVQSSLGVSLEVAAGHAIAFPIQPAGSSEDKLPVIPMPGHKKVSGIRIYPFMNGDQVAVRVAALLPAKLSTSTPQVHPVGEYVIGHLGDSLKLADLTKLGLRPLAVRVVTAPFLTDAADDPCCLNEATGETCCFSIGSNICRSCPVCCSTGFRKQLPSSAQAKCPQQNQSATQSVKPKPAVNKSN